jgi:hypothetical protein
MKIKNLFALTILLMAKNLAAETQSGETDFDVKRYDFQKTDAKVTLEHLLVDKLDSLGTIGGSFLNASFLRDDDLVYLKLKNPAVSVGDRFLLGADEGPVPIPGKFGKQVGRSLLIKGYAEVTKIVKQSVVAKLYDTSMNITVGDLVLDLFDQNFKIEPREPEKMVRGLVLRSAKNLGAIGAYDFVYIDRGEKDGLRLNDRLFVYRTAEGARVLDKERPPVNIAELVVVHLAEHAATAYVRGAEDSFSAGAHFRSAISEVKFLSDTAMDGLSAVAPKAEVQLPESRSSDELDFDDEDFEVETRGDHFAFGPGINAPVDRDGFHRPYFAFHLEYGIPNYSFPLTLTVYKADKLGFKFAPRYEYEHRLAGASHWKLIAGAGPLFDYQYSSQTNNSLTQFGLGIGFVGAAQYFFSETLFVSLAPAAIDLTFWRYKSTEVSGVSNSSADMDLAGNWSPFVSLGYTF